MDTTKTDSLPICHFKLPFPWKLLRLLEDTEKGINSDIVSWLQDGKAFKIFKPQEFSERIMKIYFKQNKLKSFTRQVSPNMIWSI
jgi:intergrase/recombinase